MTDTLFSHYINNQWQPCDGAEIYSSNPATNEVIWKGISADKHIIDAAVQAAYEAFQGWALTPIEKRIEYVEAFQNQLGENKDNFAEIISKETGKPLWEAKAEVNAMIGKVRISKDAYNDRCRELKRTQGIFNAHTRHKPHGAIAVFGPYNFPGHLPNGHIIPALIAGNTIVFKPSEFTPLVAETMLNLWDECHLPKGVINLVQGDRETGKLLAEHCLLDGLFFTGSWDTGLNLSKIFSKRPDKILALEMGGNNPYVIGNITDMKAAAFLTIQSAFVTSGQRCTCARRLIISSGNPGEQFLEALIPMIEAIRVGPYTDDPEPYMGPLINKEAADHLLNKQQKMIDDGAKPIIEMKRIKKDSAFLSPGLIDVTHQRDRVDEEIFGPLLQVIRVPDFESAIEEANATNYGLAAGLLSNDSDQWDMFYAMTRAGVVNWNAQLTGASSQAPFGGVGQSGNHRPSAYYAADYCSYPVASLETDLPKIPPLLPPGLEIQLENEDSEA